MLLSFTKTEIWTYSPTEGFLLLTLIEKSGAFAFPEVTVPTFTTTSIYSIGKIPPRLTGVKCTSESKSEKVCPIIKKASLKSPGVLSVVSNKKFS